VKISGNGIFVVGADIQPGRYVTGGADLNCYWARLKSTGGGVGSLIANGTTTERATVTIKKTDAAFETTGCKAWTRR
jgi:hypothetical protein